MPGSRSLLTPLGALLLAGLVLVTGCGNSGAGVAPRAAERLLTLRPSAVPSASTDASLSGTASRRGIYRRIWPHEDGRSWAYRLTYREWGASTGTVYSSPDDVPALTLDDAEALLRNHPVGPNPIATTGRYTLRFHGTITTSSGVTKQNLEESVTTGGALAPAAAARPSAGFLRLLAKARPDIARRIGVRVASAAPAPASPSDELFPPTLLHGYAWEQNDDWIGNFGDLNQNVSWIYLTSDLAPGSEFSLQLVPDLADNVFLHGRVLGYGTVTTDAGTFHNAAEILYLVDFGLSQATDENGNGIGYVRSYLYGSIAYVPGVGPVRSYERFIPSVEIPMGPGFDDATSILLEFATGAGGTVAAR